MPHMHKPNFDFDRKSKAHPTPKPPSWAFFSVGLWGGASAPLGEEVLSNPLDPALTNLSLSDLWGLIPACIVLCSPRLEVQK